MISHEYFQKILKYFKGDKQKTFLWFKTKNPSLGGISPFEMIQAGRQDKLKKFINSQLNGYFP